MARSFNGSSDFIEDTAVQMPQSAFTVSQWINPTSVGTTEVITDVYNSFVSRSYFQLFITATGVLNGRMQQDGQVDATYIARNTAANALTASTWQNVVQVWTGGTTNAAVKLYVNGTQVDTTDAGAGSFTAPYSGSAVTFRIGNQNAPGPLPFTGSIADVAYWSIALSAGDITGLGKGARPYQIRSTKLVSWWPLDGQQSPEPDLGGAANNGTLTGTANAFGPPFMPFTPRWHRYNGLMLPTAGLGWIINRRNKLMKC